MANVVLLVDIAVKAGMMDAFLPLMRENARKSVENEPGCLQFDVSRVEDEPNRLVLYEAYADEAAFKAHGGMPHHDAFIAQARPMMDGPPKRTNLDRVGANAKR